MRGCFSYESKLKTEAVSLSLPLSSSSSFLISDESVTSMLLSLFCFWFSTSPLASSVAVGFSSVAAEAAFESEAVADVGSGISAEAAASRKDEDAAGFDAGKSVEAVVAVMVQIKCR